jgi:uncharacterized damage-inducible protein DinB
MERNSILIDELRKSVFDDPWHGPSVKNIINDISEEHALAHPVKNAHSIFELVLHMWAWTEEVLSRLNGHPPQDPEAGDWPNPVGYNNDGWNAIKEKFFSSTVTLFNSLEKFPEDKLKDIVGGIRNPSLGTGISYEAMIHGLAQHNAYHAGQISLLKKYF